MSKSWVSIVKKNIPVELVPVVLVHAVPDSVCVDCLRPALTCLDCMWRPVLYRHAMKCGYCYSARLPSDSMCIGYIYASEAAVNGRIPARCDSCLSKRVWAYGDDQWHSKPTMLDFLRGRKVSGKEFFDIHAIYDDAHIEKKNDK